MEKEVLAARKRQEELEEKLKEMDNLPDGSRNPGTLDPRNHGILRNRGLFSQIGEALDDFLFPWARGNEAILDRTQGNQLFR